MTLKEMEMRLRNFPVDLSWSLYERVEIREILLTLTQELEQLKVEHNRTSNIASCFADYANKITPKL